MIPFLRLGPVSIPTFGLMVACAMVFAYLLLRKDFHRRGITAEAETFIAIPCLAGIAGAKLYHVLESPREFFSDPVHQLFSQYGFAWFGGLIAGCAAFLWLARRSKFSVFTILDAASPAAALGYGIGRIGCLLSGDGDYGKPSSLPWAMSFPNGLVPTTQRVHPTPVYEFIVACIIAWILWRMGAPRIAFGEVNTANLRPLSTSQIADRARSTDPAAPGRIFAMYLLLTGAARFLVEFIRINPRSFLGLTNAQAASILSMLAGAVLLFWQHAKARRPSRASEP